MSRQSRAWPETGRLCALAVVLACTIMLARVAVLVGVVSPACSRASPRGSSSSPSRDSSSPSGVGGILSPHAPSPRP